MAGACESVPSAIHPKGELLVQGKGYREGERVIDCEREELHAHLEGL